MDNLVGQQIKGYRLLETVGAGGFGAVYRAEQPQIGREVAIKIILPEYANHPDFIRRFEVEAQVIARLEHPHIIPLYDYWRDADGAYLVMRYLRGGSLRDLLKERPMTQPEASRTVDQLAGALAVAHRNGVIHRDIKPDNILFDEDRNAYLTDFGIAKDLSSEINVTKADMVVGSPAYLSPEQVRADDVTPRSDIYSMGVLIYEMLTGKHPFPTEQATALLVRHLNDPLPLVSETLGEDIPEEVENVIQQATAKNPDERFADVGTLAAAFRHAIALDDIPEAVSLPVSTEPDRTMLLEELDVDNPYKGLEAFEEVDAVNFFGRDNLIDSLLSILGNQQAGEKFLAVIGPSGSGKSSVVQAGIIPRMRGGMLPGSSKWFVVEMLPGMHPLEELEAALLRIAVNPPPSLLTQLSEDERGLLRASKRVLPDEKSELFLFIDQFEEVFTQARDQAEITHFLDSIVAAVTDPSSPLRVIITLRADFYDRPLLYPAFGDLVRRFTEVVLPMTPSELERAIVGPAERVGVHLEQGLANRIIADISAQPGALPLLQYALMELFDRREGRLLTRRTYEDIGGALGALARRADEVYQGLNPAQQERSRQLFLRMVTVGEGGIDDTRRRVTQSELVSLSDDAEAMTTLINEFGRSRLLTFDHDPATREPTIEVAHEALIREWGQLRVWLEDSREDLIMHRRLEAATNDWLHSGKDPSYLATGARLQQLETWKAEADIALRREEFDYLEASVAQREARQALEAERRAREEALERRSQARLRALVGVMSVAAIIALGLAFLALNAQQEAVQSANTAATAQAVAETNRLEAEQSAQEASSLALAANARNLLAQNNPSLALALAIEADKTFQPPSAEVQQTLSSAAYGPNVRYRLQGHTGSVLGVDMNADRAVTVSADGAMILWNLSDGSELARYTLEVPAYSVDLSADSQTIATGLFNGDVVLWDAASGSEKARFSGHSDTVSRVVFSSDETRLLSGSLDRTIRLWDIASGDELLRIDSPGAILNVAFAPDGQRAVSSSADASVGDVPDDTVDRTVRVWDLNTGAEIQRFEPNSGYVRAVDFSPDGQHVASGTWNSLDGGVVQLWNIETGSLERRFFGGHRDVITQVRFNSSGTRLLSASWDRSLVIWDVQTGVELQRLEGHEDRILSATFGPDENFVLAGTGNIGNNIPDPAKDAVADPSVWLWDLAPSRAEMRQLVGHTDWVWTVDVSPDGKLAATGAGPLSLGDSSNDTSVRVWDLSTGETTHLFEGHTNTVNQVKFTPDGRAVASASWDGTVRLWPLDGSEPRILFDKHEGSVYGLDFSDDGTMGLSSSGDGTIRLWNVDTGEEIRQFTGHDGDVNMAVFSPNEKTIASAGADKTIRLWDVATGAEICQFTGHTDNVTGVAFNPAGTMLLSTSWDSTARLWDVASGEEIRQFVGHTRVTFGPSFSPDGAYALTASADTTVRLWEVDTGEEIRRFTGHTSWVLSTVFSPDGSFILTAAEDDTARQWVMARSADELVDWAYANRYVPELTCPQRAQYRVEPLCSDS